MSVRRSPPLQPGKPRRAVFIQAFVLREGRPNLPCTLVDISDAGARLLIEDISEVPNRFTLAMTERGVPRRLCRLIWRGDNEIGVSFEAERYDRKTWNRELAPGSTLEDALDTFALRS